MKNPYELAKNILQSSDQKEQNRCAMACQGCGAVFHFHIKRQW